MHSYFIAFAVAVAAATAFVVTSAAARISSTA
jgi:hypothetical protein